MQRATARIGGKCAGVVELVDALDSKSSSERSAGSTPATRTTFNRLLQKSHLALFYDSLSSDNGGDLRCGVVVKDLKAFSAMFR